ncbi:MAG: GntR family transcriptional regulator [Bacillota bacterium]|jgi:DNA-binding GntR family transcriptional regulator
MVGDLKSVNRPKTLKQMAYQEIKTSILNGQLVAGEVYSEGKIAKALNISRTPVREAFLDLQRDGLVGALPQRGMIIRKVSQGVRDEVFLLRRTIEAMIIEQLPGKIGLHDLSRLRGILAGQQEAIEQEDMVKFLDYDEEFHLTLAELTGYHRVREILVNLRDLTRLMGMSTLQWPGRMELVLTEHKAVFQALSERDFAAAKKAMIVHLTNTERSLSEPESS